MKEVFSIPISEAAFRDHVDLVNVRELDGVKIERAEKRLAEMWQMPRELVIVDKQSIKNPTYKDPVPKLDPNSIMVLVNVDEKPIRKDFRKFLLSSKICKNRSWKDCTCMLPWKVLKKKGRLFAENIGKRSWR